MAESVFYQLSSDDPDTGNYTRAEGTPPYDVTGLPASEHRFIAPDGTVHLVTPTVPLAAPNLAPYAGTPYSFDPDTGVQTIPAPTNSGGAVTTWSLVGNVNGAVTINSGTGVVSVDTTGADFPSESFTTRASNAAGNSDQGFDVSVQASGGWQSAFNAIYDPSDLSTLFQNSDGTGAVTADGDPVGYIGDVSGNGYHLKQATAGSRGIYRTNGTQHWVELDGADDSYDTDAIAPGATPLVLVGGWERKGAGSGTTAFQGIIGARSSGTQNCRNLYISSITIHGANLMAGNAHVQAAVNPGENNEKNVVVGEFDGVDGDFSTLCNSISNSNTNATASTANPTMISVGRSREFTERAHGDFYGGAVAFSTVTAGDRDAAVAFFEGKMAI